LLKLTTWTETETTQLLSSAQHYKTLLKQCSYFHQHNIIRPCSNNAVTFISITLSDLAQTAQLLSSAQHYQTLLKQRSYFHQHNIIRPSSNNAITFISTTLSNLAQTWFSRRKI
jgi:hypothetical protein